MLRRALRVHQDAADQNIPLMMWYGIEPCVAADPNRAAELLINCKLPIVRQFIARRMAQQEAWYTIGEVFL